MVKGITNSKVDLFLHKTKKWREETKELRMIVLDCGLNEELKWGKPCYTYEQNNIVIIMGFKEYCALGFFKGALLKDTEGILFKPGDNSQAMRQIRFNSTKEIIKMKKVIKSYVKEAVKSEKAGSKIDFKDKRELKLPVELQNKFDKNPLLKIAFDSLTPGRQRAYVLYFSAPKQSHTRESRIEKYTTQILNGKGFND